MTERLPVDADTALELVGRMLARFQDSWDWMEVAEDVLAMLGQGLKVDRAYIYRVIEDEGLRWHQMGEWRAPGVEPAMAMVFAHDPRVDEQDPDIADWVARCRRREILESVVPPEAEGAFADAYRTLGIGRFLSMPIHVNSGWWGHVGVAVGRDAPPFSPAAHSALAILARLFSDAIYLSASSVALSERTRTAIMEALPDGIVLVDELGAIEDANPAACRLYGQSRLDLLNAPFLARTGLDHRPPFGCRNEAVVARPDGTSAPVEVTLTEVTAGERRLTAASLRDLSAIRAAEAEIERQRVRLATAEREAALGSLLAGVAHELNNPLAVVIAQSTLLEAKVEGGPLAERVAKVRAAADRCGRIVKSFLAMAKRSTPTLAPVDIEEVTRAAAEMTAYGARSADISVALDLAGNLPAITADRDHLVQVIANLVINAQQALLAHEGPREIRLSSRRAPGVIEIRIADTGPGVPPEIRERIFEPYFTTKPVGAGTGIGLSVSRSLLAEIGATLTLEDPGPGGTVFLLSLKVPETTDAVAKSAARHAPHVLIVDDEEDVASALADILDLFGATAEVVGSPAAALAAPPADYVFADLRMPGGGGLKLFATLLERDPSLAGRCVLVTGDTVAAAGEVKAAGLDGPLRILEKPFTLPEARRIWADLTGHSGVTPT